MTVVFVNQSEFVMPRKFVREWLRAVVRLLPLRDRKKLKGELTVVLLDSRAAKKLNKQFRGRNYATDVLSFPGMDESSLGELVICPAVIERQAIDHGLSFRDELGYMLLHGLLHLLGYDHEGSKREALRMFRLQDKMFAKLRAKSKS